MPAQLDDDLLLHQSGGSHGVPEVKRRPSAGRQQHRAGQRQYDQQRRAGFVRCPSPRPVGGRAGGINLVANHVDRQAGQTQPGEREGQQHDLLRNEQVAGMAMPPGQLQHARRELTSSETCWSKTLRVVTTR